MSSPRSLRMSSTSNSLCGQRTRLFSLMPRIHLTSCALSFAVLAHPGNAHAQTTEAVAEALFRDGKSYFQAGDYDRACPKLAQSHRIDPAGGTVLLLAICYEQQGKFASAWARYNDAFALAKRDGREDREQRAKEGLEAVEPKLSYVRLTLDPSCQRVAGLMLSIDGTELPAVSDTRLPIDAGAHSLVIKAPNYEEWHMDVKVGPAELQDVSVPALHRLAPPPAVTPLRPGSQDMTVVPDPGASEKSVSHVGIRRSAYVIGGLGLAAIGVGSYFGLHAMKLNKDANDICPTSECRDTQSAAIGKVDDARSSALKANVFIGAGSAVVLSAAVLLFVYSDDRHPKVTASTDVQLRSIALNWSQSF